MRITYRQLQKYLEKLHPDQLDSDVTVQIEDDCENNAYPAYFTIMNSDNDIGLEDKHPVFYVMFDEPGKRLTDEEVSDHILSISQDNGFGEMS